MQIIKYLTAFGLGAAGSAAWAADKAAQETVEHMPEFWSEVQEHAVNADVQLDVIEGVCPLLVGFRQALTS